MELKEGMYVRTEEGEISKIEWITFQQWEGLENTVKATFWLENDERLDYPIDNFKASFNIIDLIEEGDYVNGYEVIEKPYCYHDVCFVSVNSRESWGWGIGEMPMNEIKSIVTKEQFETMKYIIEK